MGGRGSNFRNGGSSDIKNDVKNLGMEIHRIYPDDGSVHNEMRGQFDTELSSSLSTNQYNRIKKNLVDAIMEEVSSLPVTRDTGIDYVALYAGENKYDTPDQNGNRLYLGANITASPRLYAGMYKNGKSYYVLSANGTGGVGSAIALANSEITGTKKERKSLSRVEYSDRDTALRVFRRATELEIDWYHRKGSFRRS